VLRQSGLADANRAANRLATRAGAARDLIEESIGVSGAPEMHRPQQCDDPVSHRVASERMSLTAQFADDFESAILHRGADFFRNR